MKTGILSSAIVYLVTLTLTVWCQPVNAQKTGKITPTKPAVSKPAGRKNAKPVAAKPPAAASKKSGKTTTASKPASGKSIAQNTKKDAAKNGKKPNEQKSEKPSKIKTPQPERKEKRQGAAYTLGVELANHMKTLGIQELERVRQDPVGAISQTKQHTQQRLDDLKSGRLLKEPVSKWLLKSMNQ